MTLDPLAELLARIERATFGTSIGQTTLGRWAVGLREHRTEAILLLIGDSPLSGDDLERVNEANGGRSHFDSAVWLFPDEGGVS